jgi:hypothetical protein
LTALDYSDPDVGVSMALSGRAGGAEFEASL